MSQWRRKASEELPELQPLIASKDVDRPMMLWIELNQKFEQLCESDPQPLDVFDPIELKNLAPIMDFAQGMCLWRIRFWT